MSTGSTTKVFMCGAKATVLLHFVFIQFDSRLRSRKYSFEEICNSVFFRIMVNRRSSFELFLLRSDQSSPTPGLTVVVNIGRVTTVPVVGGVVVELVVLERPGSHMLKFQNVVSVMGADSGPFSKYNVKKYSI